MTERPWTPYDVEFYSDIDRPDYAVALWAGHRWFGYDLVRWAKPERIVELGSHYGCSFFAFCQAVQADRSDCDLMAIDTWEGDEHTGHYDESVYHTFTTVLERRFAGLRTRVQRSTFDDALAVVPDGSVDILHIDGLHTYEAVCHDYETWKDKVAPNGIVLFHDVAPSSGLGSARYWQEVRETGPSFAFLHSLGLGVLLPNGTEGREALLDLGRSPWRPYYEHRAGHDLRSRQVIDLTAMIDARDEALAATERLVVDRDEALVMTDRLVAERDQALITAQAMIVQRDDALAATGATVEQCRHELADVEQLVAARDDALAAARTEMERLDRSLAEANERRSKLEVDLARAAADSAHRLQLAEADRAEALAEIEYLHHHIAALTVDRDAVAAGLDLYRRVLRPVRWASRPPRQVLRRIRGRDETDVVDIEPGTGIEPDTEIEAGPTRPALFDGDWYLARYPDVGRAGVDPWTHWRDHGWKEGREPCPLFNAGTYLEQHDDVAAAGIDPLIHWTESGRREDRDPSRLFSTDFYRNRNEQRLTDEDDPLRHYLDNGIQLGLFVSPEHEQRVLNAPLLQAGNDNLLVDVVAHHDGSSRSVPYSMIVDLDADLFTFDLWDSILTRSRPADASKLATARRMRLALGLSPGQSPSTWDLMRRRVEIEAAIAGPSNGEYLLGDVLARLLAQVAAEGLDPVDPDGTGYDAAALADHLRRLELEDEMASTTPIGDTVVVIEKLLARGDSARVAVVSDFYLSGDDLRDLLAYHGLSSYLLEVISSADIGLSKHRGGELLAWVRDRFGVEAGRHVHVGDNPHADVAMQTETGGIAVHLVHGDRRFVGPGQLTEATMADVAAELRADLDAAAQLRCRQNGLSPRPDNRIIRAAWRTAVLPVALVAAAIEDATARNLDRVHYLSREGLFLSRIHDEIAPILEPQGAPAGVHLAVSRRSTFGPSLQEISPSSLLDLWRMYSRQTPRGLLVSLGAEADEFRPALQRCDLELDEVIDGIHLDGRIRTFLEDPKVTDTLQTLNTERRHGLLAYLERRTDLDLDEMLMVDVGWRGTVQDNLARLLPDTRFVGWYLALFPFLNPQRPDCYKFAIGPDGNLGDDISFMEPPAAVERPWTPAAPSVVDYRSIGSEAGVPVLDEESLTDESRAAIELYQDAVVDAAAMVARWIVANGAATDVLRPLIETQLTSYYKTPEPGIADLWFNSAHDDTFGVLNVTSFGKAGPSREWLAGGPGPAFLRHLEDAATGSLWPAGYRRWQPVEAAVALEQALRTDRFDRR